MPSKDLINLRDNNEQSQKRKSDDLSPDPDNSLQKKYIWDERSLIKQNRFYLPTEMETEADIDNSTEENSTKKNKIPPIFLHNANNHLAIIEDIKKVTTDEFSTKYTTNFLRINLSSETDYRNLTKYYLEHKLNFHTFHNPENSPLTVVIRNVPISLKEDEILEALKSQKLPVLKVVRLLSKEKKAIPLCCVDLTKNEQAENIYKLDRLFNSVVTVEPRRKSRDIAQCTRCQRYGHTKNYCQLEPRCVKCKGNHIYSDCPKRPNEAPVCVNCDGQHSANYKGCSYYQKFKTMTNHNHPLRPDATPFRMPEHNNTRRSTVNPHLTYATATRGQQAQNNSSQQTPNSSSQQAQYSNSQQTQQGTVNQIMHAIVKLITPYLSQIKEFVLSHILPLFFNVP